MRAHSRAARRGHALQRIRIEAPVHTLACVTCFRAEDHYLAEWLEYHRCVGVDHVYLYDNDGGERARRIYARYVEAGFVTVHRWPARPKSLLHGNFKVRCYPHCIAHHRDECVWLLKIDVDEFLVPVDGAGDVKDALRRYDPQEVRGIRVPRFNFGDNGHRARPPGLVIESYTRREARWSNHKDIASVRHLDSNRYKQSSHHFRYRLAAYGRRYVREAEVRGLRIHHYYTKSLEEYLERQNPSGGRERTLERFVERNAGRNEVEDRSLLQYVPALKRALGER